MAEKRGGVSDFDKSLDKYKNAIEVALGIDKASRGSYALSNDLCAMLAALLIVTSGLNKMLSLDPETGKRTRKITLKLLDEVTKNIKRMK